MLVDERLPCTQVEPKYDLDNDDDDVDDDDADDDDYKDDGDKEDD